MRKSIKIVGWALLALIIAGFCIPQQVHNPVEGCGTASYNHKTFWCPWGDHHHHGVDIFASKGTPIHSAVPLGIVIATTSADSFGKANLGGNTVTILGTHGRVYYYAHMKEVKTHIGAIVTRNSVIGTVGDTGNAKGKPSHCHFSILTAFPQMQHYVPSEQRTMPDDYFKIFFVNPVEALDY